MIRRYTIEDESAVLSLWERSVRASHNFLCEDDIAAYRPLVRAGLSSVPAVSVACGCDAAPQRDAGSGSVDGFIAYDGTKIEMLFVDTRVQGRGIGRALVAHVANLCAGAPLAVDVNEQNHAARAFYERLGFTRLVSRRAMDDTGRAYPILSLSQ